MEMPGAVFQRERGVVQKKLELFATVEGKRKAKEKKGGGFLVLQEGRKKGRVR